MRATASVSVAHDRVQRGAFGELLAVRAIRIQAIGIEKGKPFSPTPLSFSLSRVDSGFDWRTSAR
jgi:hypothetical protein